MEGWENKILNDKLNSLQGLPSGYMPDLSSKWEIVAAGLPASPKKQLVPVALRWSAVAAAMLLAIGLIWMNTSEKKTDSSTVSQNVGQQQLPQNQVTPPKVFSNNTEGSFIAQPGHETIAITSPQKVQPTEKSARETAPELVTLPVLKDTNQGGVAVLHSPDTIRLANIEKPETTTALAYNKPAKKKIYQRDFNDGILVMDTGFAPAGRQHFSIRLKPFSPKTPDETEEAMPRLQLKQAF